MKMDVVDMQTYDAFVRAFVAAHKKKEYRVKDGVATRYYLIKGTNETICSESHRGGKAVYLINPNFRNGVD